MGRPGGRSVRRSLAGRFIARVARAALLAALLLARAMGGAPALAETTLRVGHFPNVTHAQALVAHHLSRQGKGWFEARLGPGVTIEWYVYNAGPSAMEAIFAHSVDLAYVGPSPAINAYAKAAGEDIRIIAGAIEGGAALVVQAESGLNRPDDFRGKKIGTPQLGNTQDVAARAWLAAGGLRITLTGGDAMVVPTANPDQLALFQGKRLDAVWTVEPWVSRLESEAGGRVVVEEKDAVTTVLVSGTKFLGEQRPLAQRFVAAHEELTQWMRDNPAEAQAMLRDELGAEMRSEMKAELVQRAWRRIVPSAAVSRAALERYVANAKAAGFLRAAPDLSRLIERP
jgi:NitT/TauT family transport system substrate-binding protein